MNQNSNSLNSSGYQTSEPDAQNIELKYIVYDFFKGIKKFGWLVVVLALVLSLITYAYVRVTHTDMYESTATFTINPLVSSNSQSGLSNYLFNYNENLSEQMAATFPYVLNSDILNAIVENALDRPMNGTVSCTAVSTSNIFVLTVRSSSANDAFDIANALIENYPKVAEYILGDTRIHVITECERATAPCNTDYYKLPVFISAFIGLLVGMVMLLVYVLTRNTILQSSDITVKLNQKCICEIPYVRNKRGSNNNQTMLRVNNGNFAFSEAMRTMKRRVKNVAERKGMKVIGITSSVTGEGKTTVAFNLARVFAKGGDKVLLIDMDLYRKSLQKYMNKDKEKIVGVAEVVSGKADISYNTIHELAENFHVLYAGSEDIQPVKGDFDKMFSFVRDVYDYVIVDMPPCGVVSDSISIADLCDTVVFNVKWDFASVERIRSAIKYLSFSKTGIMGFVINEVKNGGSEYGRYRSYGKYGKYGKNSKNSKNNSYLYGYGYGYGQELDESDKTDSQK